MSEQIGQSPERQRYLHPDAAARLRRPGLLISNLTRRAMASTLHKNPDCLTTEDLLSRMNDGEFVLNSDLVFSQKALNRELDYLYQLEVWELAEDNRVVLTPEGRDLVNTTIEFAKSAVPQK